jgi:hypothetical protein
LNVFVIYRSETFGDLESLMSKTGRKSSSFSKEKDILKYPSTPGGNNNNEDGTVVNTSTTPSHQSQVLKHEKEMSEEIRSLLKSISNRDQVLSASRRAFQKLDRECKRAIYYTLRKILDKEKENFEFKKMHLDKLDRSLSKVNIEEDMNTFIDTYQYEEGSLVLNSHALSLLSDLQSHSGQVNLHNNFSSGNNNNSSSSIPQSLLPQSPGAPLHHQPPPSALPSSNSSSSVPSATSTPSHSHSHSITSTIRRSLTGKSSKHSSSSDKDKGKDSGDESSSSYKIKQPSSQSLQTLQSISSMKSSSSSPPGRGKEGINTFSTPPNQQIQPQSSLTLFAEEYSKHLTNIFYAMDEKKTSTTHSTTSSNPSPRLSATKDDETEGEENSEGGLPEKGSGASDVARSHSHSEDTTEEPPAKPKTLLKDETDKDPYAQLFTSTRRFSVNANEVRTLSKQEILNISSNPSLRESVEWLCNNVRSTKGRETFISELNQFRSKKVDLQSGFSALVIVLWTALTYCQRQNDVRTAKVIMMLSQVKEKKKSFLQVVHRF